MSKLYLDLAIAIFFLVALVFVFNLKSQIQSRDKSTFNFLFTGLSTLAVMSLFTAVQNQLLAQEVIAASITPYAEFVRMTMFLLGLVLLTTGVARWLSIVTKRSEDVSSFAGNDLLLKRISFELSSPTSLNDFMPVSLKLLSDSLPVKSVAVYSISKTNNRAQLIACESTFTELAMIAREIVFTPGWVNGLTESMLTFADEKVMSAPNYSNDNRYCFAVSLSGKPKFLYVLSTNQYLQRRNDQSTLISSISNTFKSKVAAQRNSLKLQHQNNCRMAAKSISNCVLLKDTINEKVAAIKGELSNYVSVDFVSICSINKNGVGRRISIGESGTILNEIGVNVVGDGGYVFRSINENKTQVIADFREIGDDLIPELLKMTSIDALLVMPLAGLSGIKGALTVGTKITDGYSSVEKEIVEAATGTFERLLHEMAIEEKVTDVSQRERLVQEFVFDIATSETENEMFQRAARTIYKITDSSFIRISTIDSDQKFISSRALVFQDSMKILVPENGHMLLSILPWHKIAAVNGNTVMVNCGTTQDKMSDIETRQVFAGGARRAVVVPIKYGSKVYGFISLAQFTAEMTDILSADSIQFVETIASLLALSIDATNRNSDSLAEFAATARTEIIESSKNKSMRNQLRSSLTSILGSVEMIRIGQPGHEFKDSRFLSIIDKSAHKLEELLKE